MNNWNGSGFISSDINIKEITTKNGEAMKMARFSIACQRKGKNAGADFISCVAYGKNAEFCERWMHKASGVEIRGHIQTGSYEGKNGKVYTTDVICDEFEDNKYGVGYFGSGFGELAVKSNEINGELADLLKHELTHVLGTKIKKRVEISGYQKKDLNFQDEGYFIIIDIFLFYSERGKRQYYA